MFNLNNLMIFFAVLTTLIQLVEQILGTGTGDQKKKAVTEAIQKLVVALKLNVPAIIMGNLGLIIDAIVAIYNAIGPFVHGSEEKPK